MVAILWWERIRGKSKDTYTSILYHNVSRAKIASWLGERRGRHGWSRCTRYYRAVRRHRQSKTPYQQGYTDYLELWCTTRILLTEVTSRQPAHWLLELNTSTSSWGLKVDPFWCEIQCTYLVFKCSIDIVAELCRRPSLYMCLAISFKYCVFVYLDLWIDFACQYILLWPEDVNITKVYQHQMKISAPLNVGPLG